MRSSGCLILDMVQIFIQSHKLTYLQGDNFLHNVVIFISLDKE